MDTQSDGRQKKFAKIVKASAFVFQIALSVLCPIVLLILVGIRLDSAYGNGNHWFTLAGSLLGIYAAYRSTFLLIRDNFLKKEDSEKKTDDGEWSMDSKKE